MEKIKIKSNFEWRSIGIQTSCESGDPISNIIEDLEVICEALIYDIVDNNIRNQVDKISENNFYDAIDEIMPIIVEEDIKNKYRSEMTYDTCFLILVMSVRSMMEFNLFINQVHIKCY
jgi:hypothetical protein